VTYRDGVETFFVSRNSQSIEGNTFSVEDPKLLAAKYCQRTSYTQSILEYRLNWPAIAGLFWCLWPNDLRCECARVHCALFMAWVKVIGHMEGKPGCGKVRHGRARTTERRREHPGTLRTASKAHPPAQNGEGGDNTILGIMH